MSGPTRSNEPASSNPLHARFDCCSSPPFSIANQLGKKSPTPQAPPPWRGPATPPIINTLGYQATHSIIFSILLLFFNKLSSASGNHISQRGRAGSSTAARCWRFCERISGWLCALKGEVTWWLIAAATFARWLAVLVWAARPSPTGWLAVSGPDPALLDCGQAPWQRRLWLRRMEVRRPSFRAGGLNIDHSKYP
jgi:hypothetical protein